MTSEFIPMDLALRLKALGFNEPCFGYYKAEYEDGINPLPINLILEQNKASSNVFYKTSAPTFQQAFRFFREKYGLIGWIEGKQMYAYRIESTIPTDDQLNKYPFRKYEEAELACLEKLIEIVESKTE